jgi:small subunit ribosomal protein S7
MPPRLNLYGASRSLSIRASPSIASYKPINLRVAAGRGFADDKEPKSAATGLNQDVLGHVSEEAADMGKVTGETQPDLGQGTPVQEVRLRPIRIAALWDRPFLVSC